ncbi:hypothetical protein GFS24_05935 [Chitinophaga sp. SYP-B3965]|uniref:hypothetical protein n=1 Tax=Chitinophaga sp. SYP-B3965 TaxID=2663120 RepID=UPI0012999DF1|nr:hypothetical protein [Chitinophaga sp. SYP-B3965]MRG44643.1 hypothetical protein [Chitinophaga sp. SYP-B3965]
MKKSLFSPWLRSLFAVCSIILLLTVGCHKNKDDTTVEISSAAYFTLSADADTRLPLLLTQVKAAETKAPFFADIVQKYGDPVWDKGIIGERGTTTVYAIPLKPQGKGLSGCIVFELGEELRFKVYENRDFFRYGFSTQKGAVTGRKVRNLMMALNFRLPPDDPNNPLPPVPPEEECVNTVREAQLLEQARAANPGKKLQLQNRMISVTTCYSWTTCTGDGNGNCVGQIYYHEECVTNTYWYPDNGGGGNSGGGGSGAGPGEGGGGGGGAPGNPPSNPQDPQDPCPPIEEPLPDPVPVAEEDMLELPCPSSFNLVRQASWQSCVTTNYRFGLFNRAGNQLNYYVEIGAMEVGLPYTTYNGTIIHHAAAQAMITQAAVLAEGEALAALSAYLIINPHIPPSQVNYEHYKQIFKSQLKWHLDNFLRSDYYDDDEKVKPSRVTFDSASFGLKDATKYRPFKFRGVDC